MATGSRPCSMVVSNRKAVGACLTLAVLAMAMSSSSAQQSANERQPHRQHAICSLKMQGHPEAKTLDSLVSCAQLSCNSTSPIAIGVNSTYLGKHVSKFTGVQVVSNLACQQQARGRWLFPDGTRMPLLAMLYFCGDYHITLQQPTVLNIATPLYNTSWDPAILSFGGSTRATIRQGSFIGNWAGSIAVAIQTAVLSVQDHTVAELNGGPAGAMWALDNAKLVLQNAVFRHNIAQMGGAVSCCYNASISVDSCVFDNNTADTQGGAVEVNCTGGQQAVISNSSFIRNSAAYGGAVYIRKHIRAALRDCSFYANQADSTGAAAYLKQESSTDMLGCTFSSNNATNGAGIDCDNCRLQVANTVLVNNSAVNQGGGVLVAGEAQATFANTTISHNSASDGGGIAVSTNASLGMHDCSVTANLATTSGGGVYLNINTTTVLSGCQFLNNRASWGGGAHCQSCRMQGDHLLFAHNTAGEDGGGLAADDNTDCRVSPAIVLRNSRWQNNTAYMGGGLAVKATTSIASVTLSSSMLSGNTARAGGGAYFENAEATVNDTLFLANSAEDGGGASAARNTTVSLARSNFTTNQASFKGGGIGLGTNTTVAAVECILSRNIAGSSTGGALDCNNCTVLADRLSVSHNYALLWDGGLNAGGYAQAELNNNTWQANSAEYGGALYIIATDYSYGRSLATSKRGLAEVHSSTFAGNSARMTGGAVALQQSANVNVWNSSIVYNTAQRGGAVGCEDSSRATLGDSRLAGNKAEGSGGAVYCDSSEVEVLQCLVADNACQGYGGGLYSLGICKVVLVSSNFTSCTASRGGALGLDGATNLYASNSSFWSNAATSTGGAVYALGNSSSFITNSTFATNKATQGGGAVSMTDSAQVLASVGCSFAGNSANDGGAVITVARAKLTLSNSSLLGNVAYNSGGALALGQTSVVVVTAGSIVSGNRVLGARSFGGGIVAGQNSLLSIIEGTRVQANNASSGGGVYASGSSQVVMEGSSVSHNRASGTGGGLYFADNASSSFTGCTVASNAAGNDGGGLVGLGEAMLALNNSLVVNNSAGGGGGIKTDGTAQLMLLGGIKVTGNRAHNGWGGGTSLSSNKFDIGQVTAAVQHNTAAYDVNAQSKATSLIIVGNSSVYGFANRIGKDEGLLSVVVNVCGFYGLPCQAVQAQAKLADGTFLGSSRSDKHGLAQLALKVARPPGVYVISISTPNWPGLSAANLTLHIRKCVRGEVTPSPDACQPCQQGFYSFDPSQAVCSTCPANANCSGGDAVTPLPGYWRSSADSIQIQRCPNPTACTATNEAALLACAAETSCGTSNTYKDLQCAAGYYGNLCGMCSPGTGASRLLRCRTCMSSGSVIALYVIAALVMLCLIKLMCHLNRNQDQDTRCDGDQKGKVPLAQLLRPLLLYSQYMLIVYSMPIDWPVSIARALEVLGWVWSPASPETLSIDCLLPRNTRLPLSIQKVLFYVGSPLVILVLLLLVEMVQFRFARAQKHGVVVHVKDILHSSCLVALFFFYPSLLRTLFSIFACVSVDQPALAPYVPAAVGSYWVLDMNQQCFTGYHRVWSLAFGLPCILLVCLGLPLGVLFLLFAKKAHLDNHTVRQHYGFLYMSYRQQLYCWECVQMTQTMVLVAISVFGVNLGVQYQVVAVNAALILMVILLLIFKPYAYRQAGMVTLQGGFCLLLTTYTGLTFLQLGNGQPSPLYSIIMGSVVLLVNVSFVVSVVWQLLKSVNWQQVCIIGKVVLSKLMCGQCAVQGTARLGVGSLQKQPSLLDKHHESCNCSLGSKPHPADAECSVQSGATL